MERWANRKITGQGNTIQERLFKVSAKNQSSYRKTALFSWFMEDVKVSKAPKLLENSNKEQILPLTKETFEVLLKKQPKASEASNDMLTEEVQNVHPAI